MYRLRFERRAPAVVPVDLDERREAGQSRDGVGEQNRLGPLAAGGSRRRERALAERHHGRERAATDDDEMDSEVVDPMDRRASELDDLAARWGAPRRKPAGLELHDVGERVGGAQLDRAVAQLHVRELDSRVDRRACDRAKGAPSAAIEGPEPTRGDLAGPGDPHDAVGGGERRERLPQREVLGDDAAARDIDDERDRDRDAQGDEQRPSGPGAGPQPGHAGRRGGTTPALAERHASPRYEARTRSFERNASASSASVILPVSRT